MQNYAVKNVFLDSSKLTWWQLYTLSAFSQTVLWQSGHFLHLLSIMHNLHLVISHLAIFSSAAHSMYFILEWVKVHRYCILEFALELNVGKQEPQKNPKWPQLTF